LTEKFCTIICGNGFSRRLRDILSAEIQRPAEGVLTCPLQAGPRNQCNPWTKELKVYKGDVKAGGMRLQCTTHNAQRKVHGALRMK